jgi:hypothetical protein
MIMGCTQPLTETSTRNLPGDENWFYGYDHKEKATVLQMEKSILTEIEKGETGEERTQEHAHNFLWHEGDCYKEFVAAGQTVNFA